MTEEGTSSSPHFHSSKGSPHIAIPSSQIQVSQDSMNSLQEKNIDDILEQREWEVRNVGNWLDGEGEEFFRLYNDLPLPPTKGPLFREREPAQHPPLRKPPTSPKSKNGSQNNREKKRRCKWSDEQLRDAIKALDYDYKIHEVCEAFNIPRSTLRDHYNGRIKSRKMGPKHVLNKEEEEKVVAYVVEMARLAHPLTPTDLKLKVAEICQTRHTPLKDGIPGRSWLYWFQKRHIQLVLKQAQGLEVNRVKNLCPSMVQVFYENLENLYNKYHYQPSEIWNVYESKANASKNGVGRVFAAKGTRSVHSMIPNEREWLSVLTTINANGDTISNFYIFKGIRPRGNYLALCESGATYGMQKKGWVDAYQFTKWMDHFIYVLREKGLLTSTNRYLLILDGHKAHLTLDVLTKARRNQIDMLTIPSHTSHGLQPLNVACFKPFKVAFRAHKQAWNVRNHGSKVRKQDLAS